MSMIEQSPASHPGRGGSRPGAGRKPKPRPEPVAPLAETIATPPLIPEVGDIVLVGWTEDDLYTRERKRVPRPAVVIETNQPGDPASDLTVALFDIRQVKTLYSVPHAPTLRPGYWSWPARRTGQRPGV